jgi:polysaccharide biosynthesis/export protein
MRNHIIQAAIGLILASVCCGAESETLSPAYTYQIGMEDELVISVADSLELPGTSVRIDDNGEISLPLLGRVRAAGLTTRQLENELTERLKRYIREPQVSVTVKDFRSQPVSVLGAVRNPGVHFLRGPSTLVEVLALAGGLREDAGNAITVTRRIQYGKIPLGSASEQGEFSIAEINLRMITEAEAPENNILVRAHDVISVPRAEMVYVVGEVIRAGGFVLNEKENLSVLQALSLAGGLQPEAAPKNARILRAATKAEERKEVEVDVKSILQGKVPDVSLMADDILFIPGSGTKKASRRVLEAAIQTISGVAIWRSARF